MNAAEMMTIEEKKEREEIKRAQLKKLSKNLALGQVSACVLMFACVLFRQ